MRDDGVTDPQARKERLVERADIDDALALIEPLKRGKRPAAVPEFAGIVVLDDPCILFPCPGEKFKATGHREHDARRELVGGRHEHGAGVRRRLDARADVDALAIDGNRMDRRAGGQQGLSRQRITGIFNPDLPVAIWKDADDDVDRLLRSRRDHDLFGIASHRPGRLQVFADRLSKLDRSARVGISKMARIQRTKGTCAELAP